MRALPTEVAVTTFDEVPLGYSRDEAMAEARRAGDADLRAAQAACPFHVDMGGLARTIAAGEFDAALDLVRAAHPWPGILGRHCHAPCVRAHSLGDGVEPLFVGALERAAADHGDGARVAFSPAPPRAGASPSSALARPPRPPPTACASTATQSPSTSSYPSRAA